MSETMKKRPGQTAEKAARAVRRPGAEANKAGKSAKPSGPNAKKPAGTAKRPGPEADKGTKKPDKTRADAGATRQGRQSAAARPDRSKKPAVEAAKAAARRHDRPAERQAGGAKSRAVASPAGKGGAARAGRRRDDLFLEKKKGGRGKSRRRPPKGGGVLIGALNACLIIGIAVLVALGVRQHGQYKEFLAMREVVDRQTFFGGTTVEGVDVSRMTLSNAVDYWRDRVEPRYAGRTVVLDNGASVTAGELGYTSDYEAVLYAAWSAGRSGSLEQRYRAALVRTQNPVAYRVTRVDYSDAAVGQYVDQLAAQVDEPAVDASIESFDAENFEFVFAESREGKQLEREATRQSIEAAIAAGGGSVALQISTVPPEITTEEVSSRYGLIDYAITNANSSSTARLNNIRLAMSFLNGVHVAPGETFSFNDTVGQRTISRGFRKAGAYSAGELTEEVGGGICQVSTTLFNAAVKADMEIVERHNHSLTVGYVDKGKDATVYWGNQDFRFKNNSADDVIICCYLTKDNRVRFGLFGRLLPNGEKITLEAVTTEKTEYETEYQPSPLLAPGQTYVLQPGRNGYKAEAYKIRWDAQGNQLSRELLCKSYYHVKNEIIQYGV